MYGVGIHPCHSYTIKLLVKLFGNTGADRQWRCHTWWLPAAQDYCYSRAFQNVIMRRIVSSWKVSDPRFWVLKCSHRFGRRLGNVVAKIGPNCKAFDNFKTDLAPSQPVRSYLKTSYEILTLSIALTSEYILGLPMVIISPLWLISTSQMVYQRQIHIYVPPKPFSDWPGLGKYQLWIMAMVVDRNCKRTLLYL